MFHIILLNLWATAQAGLPMGNVPETPDGEVLGFEETAYPCFTAMICLHKNETHNKFSECMLPDMHEKHVRKAVYFVNPDGLDTSPYKSLYDFHARTYCSVTAKEREKIFDYMKKEVLEFMSGGCIQNDDPEFCTSWEDIITCTVDLCQEMESKGMCDIEALDSA